MKENDTNRNSTYTHIIRSLVILNGILIVISCIIPFTKKNKVKAIESALVNPKYAATIQEIKIKIPTSEETLILHKSGTIWTGTNVASTDRAITKDISAPQSNMKEIWPASTQTATNIIQSATKVVSMYIKSDNNKSWNSLGVDENNARTVTFYTSSGEIVSELYFGMENNNTNRVYVRSGKNLTVYEIDNEITTFLTTETSFWCDPYLYPLSLIGASEKETQTALRHGKLIELDTSKGEYATTINKDFGNGAEIKLSIYKGNAVADETDYYVFPSFIPSPAFTEEEKAAVASLSYAYSISSWTYEKLIKQ